MHVIWELLVTLTFFLVQWTWRCCQRLKWRLDGTHRRIQYSARPEYYHRSAHVLDIVFKHCFDPVCLPNSEKYFLLVSREFIHPKHVLRDEVSLYTVNQNEAVFIEAPSGVEVWRNKYGAFHKQAQFHYGRRIIRVPLEVFYKLTSELDDPNDKLVFDFIIPRSGSALMCKIFEVTGRAVAYAEPHIFTQPFHHLGRKYTRVLQDNPKALHGYLSAVARYLCKPGNCNNNPPLVYVFKVAMNFARDYAPVYRACFPGAKFLFQYRDGAACVASMDRSFGQLPVHRALLFFKSIPGVRTLLVRAETKYGSSVPDPALLQLVASSRCPKYLTRRCMWACAVRDYLHLRRACVPLRALRYEDLVHRPRKALRLVFAHCGIPASQVEKALGAFSEDAHANSPMSRSKTAATDTRHIEQEEQGGHLRAEVQALCGLLQVPPLQAPLHLPGSLTP